MLALSEVMVRPATTETGRPAPFVGVVWKLPSALVAGSRKYSAAVTCPPKPLSLPVAVSFIVGRAVGRVGRQRSTGGQRAALGHVDGHRADDTPVPGRVEGAHVDDVASGGEARVGEGGGRDGAGGSGHGRASRRCRSSRCRCRARPWSRRRGRPPRRLTLEPPVAVSSRSAVTVIGVGRVGRVRSGRHVGRGGPRTSVAGDRRGAFVSRKVSMPPKAVCVGSAVVIPSLSRWVPDSTRASLESAPDGHRDDAVGGLAGNQRLDDLTGGVGQLVGVAGDGLLVDAEDAHRVRQAAEVGVPQEQPVPLVGGDDVGLGERLAVDQAVARAEVAHVEAGRVGVECRVDLAEDHDRLVVVGRGRCGCTRSLRRRAARRARRRHPSRPGVPRRSCDRPRRRRCRAATLSA